MDKPTLLILGCGITPGGELTPDAAASAVLATKLYTKGAIAGMIASGNYGYKSDFVPPRSEARALRDKLTMMGVPEEDILIEDTSRDTFGNAFFTARDILAPAGIHDVAVLPGPNHSPEKLRYIFTKVLGAQYQYLLIDRFNDRPGEAEREHRSLQELKELFDNVPDGDLEAIHDRLMTGHPAYKTGFTDPGV